MAGERKPSSESDSVLPGQQQRRTQRRTVKPERSAQQPSQGAAVDSGARPAGAPTRERQRSPPAGSAGPVARPQGTIDGSADSTIRPKRSVEGAPDLAIRSKRSEEGSASRADRQVFPGSRDRNRASPPTSRTSVQDTVKGSQREERETSKGRSRSRTPSSWRAAAVAADGLHATARQGGLPRPHGGHPTDPPPDKKSSAGSAVCAEQPYEARRKRARPKCIESPAAGPSAAGPSAAGQAGASRKIRLGIETEFLLATRNPPGSPKDNVDQFVKDLAINYNAQKPPSHPQMLEHPRWLNKSPVGYTKWAMDFDSTIRRPNEKVFALEMITPILHVIHGSGWRDQVKGMWEYLGRRYEITKNDTCGTHIHISLDPACTKTELQQIASSIIHFETAFEALLPAARRGKLYCQSNWLASDVLARMGRSRPESIAAIAKAGTLSKLVQLMQPDSKACFAWNFHTLYTLGTIEFRLPPPSVTADEALSWAELALTFIQASIKLDAPAGVSVYPAHLEGLRSFLETADVSGVNEPHRWQSLWVGKHPTAAVEPEFFTGGIQSTTLKPKINSLLKEDKNRIRAEKGVFDKPDEQPKPSKTLS